MVASPARRLGLVVALLVFGALAAGGCDGSSSEESKDKSTGKEAIQKFLDQLAAAVRNGDTDFRVARLHPAVIERYGEQQCRDLLASPASQDPSRADKVFRVDKPAPFDFTTDDGVIPVPNGQLVLVRQTFQKNKGDRELHVALVDGEYRYFVDCGTPIVRQ